MNTYSQKILNDQEYKIWINENQSFKICPLTSLSNKKFQFSLLFKNNIDNKIIIKNSITNMYNIFNNYDLFKKFYESQNKFVELPEKFELFFDDSDILFYELEIRDQILNKEKALFENLMNEYELNIFPEKLNNEKLVQLEDQFKDYRIQKEDHSKLRILFTYYFIEYFRLKIKSDLTITSFNNILNQEVFVPNIKIGDKIVDIYNIVRTNEFLNKTINIRLLKDEIDDLIYEFMQVFHLPLNRKINSSIIL